MGASPRPARDSASSRLVLEYDGRRFHGWADQPGKRTVCSVLTDALRTLLREDVTLVCAGRTDAGVHARGQVVSYDGPVPERLRSLNALLPDDIGVISAEPAPAGFNARFDAKARRYEYRIHTRRTGPSPFTLGRELWWPHRADLGLLQACAAALVGEHDFTAFTPAESAHRRFERRVFSCAWDAPDGETLVYRIEADAFMRNMNRILVGTMLEVASGRRELDDFVRLLEGRPRAEAGVTARPHGLYLDSVRY
jgi:tRNA pseudouridine38-40 synthase